MKVILHPHARQRLKERGATRYEVEETVEEGEQFPAKFGRIGFRKNFPFNDSWLGKRYKTKQLEVYGVREVENFVVITIIVKYF